MEKLFTRSFIRALIITAVSGLIIVGGVYAYETLWSGKAVITIEPPTIAFSPSSFSFNAQQGKTILLTDVLQISNSGGKTLNWSVSSDADWLHLPSNSGSGGVTASMSICVNVTGMDAGNYTANITISAPGASNSPQTVVVNLGIVQIPQNQQPQNQQPIEIICAKLSSEPPSPGGPIVEMTLKNVGVEPVVSLGASLKLSRYFTSVFFNKNSFNFSFGVTPSNPLLPGKSISAKCGLIGGGFSDDVSYPVEISGALQNGTRFAYTELWNPPINETNQPDGMASD